MKFMLMCCFDEKRWHALSEAERQKIMNDYGEFERKIESAGQRVTSVKLEPVAAAATVRAKSSKVVSTDGPFAETKEQLGGVHLIECRDIDEAISIAARIPTLAAGGVVEVRPVQSMAAN